MRIVARDAEYVGISIGNLPDSADRGRICKRFARVFHGVYVLSVQAEHRARRIFAHFGRAVGAHDSALHAACGKFRSHPRHAAVGDVSEQGNCILRRAFVHFKIHDFLFVFKCITSLRPIERHALFRSGNRRSVRFLRGNQPRFDFINVAEKRVFVAYGFIRDGYVRVSRKRNHSGARAYQTGRKR